MIAAELRYAWNVAVVIMLFLCLVIGAVGVQRATHLSSAASLAIAVTIAAVVLFDGFCLWLRRKVLAPGRGALPQNAAKPVAARWVPGILTAVSFGCGIYGVVDAIVRNRVDNDPLPQSFYTCLYMLLFLFFTEGHQWLARRAGREIARPLRIRGLIRLALFGIAIVAWALLAPRFGAGMALFISVPSVAAIFLLLRKVVDL